MSRNSDLLSSYQTRGPVTLFQAFLSELLVPSSCPALVSAGGGSHVQSMKLLELFMCTPHIYRGTSLKGLP